MAGILTHVAADLAVLLLITHVSFQILPPLCISRSQDGLWRLRYWLLGVSVLLPTANALIPFFRMPKDIAYNFDGIYCSVFSGSLWLSLALSWIPRYILWLYLLGLLLRLYVYIHAQSSERPRESIDSTGSAVSFVVENNVTACSKDERMSGDVSHAVDRPRSGPTGQRSSNASLRTLGSGIQKPRNQFRAVAFYPIFYVLAWLVPFSAQVAALSTGKSINAGYGLRVAAVCCVSSLGVIDVLIFCSKEKPWRYGIQVRDRGRHSRQSSLEEAGPGEVEAVYGQERRPLNKGSDLDRVKALQAYERLALERADALSRSAPVRVPRAQDLALSDLADLDGTPTSMPHQS